MKRIRMFAKFDGKCNFCLKSVTPGDEIFYDPDHKAVFHPGCKDEMWVQVVGRKKMWETSSPVKRGGLIYTGKRNG